MPNTQKYEKLITLVEVIGFIAFALPLKRVLAPLIWRFAGPVSHVTVLVVLTGYMRARGISWSEMGLRPLPGIKAKLMVIPRPFLFFWPLEPCSWCSSEICSQLSCCTAPLIPSV